jgi:hypothetical protein
MKRYILLQLALLFYSVISVAQYTDCNRTVWINRFTNLLPKEVCIPKGNYHITEVYERIDLNGDGLEDFVFDWNKNPLQDGDTLYVSIYNQNPDSTFYFFRTFNNLYPINFKSYSLDYIPQNDNLRTIQRKFNDQYPFLKLTFEKETIQITMKEDAEANLIITYKFDKLINNWRYEKSEEYFLVAGGYKPIDLSEKLGPTIDNFTYFIWGQED